MRYPGTNRGQRGPQVNWAQAAAHSGRKMMQPTEGDKYHEAVTRMVVMATPQKMPNVEQRNCFLPRGTLRGTGAGAGGNWGAPWGAAMGSQAPAWGTELCRSGTASLGVMGTHLPLLRGSMAHDTTGTTLVAAAASAWGWLPPAPPFHPAPHSILHPSSRALLPAGAGKGDWRPWYHWVGDTATCGPQA